MKTYLIAIIALLIHAAVFSQTWELNNDVVPDRDINVNDKFGISVSLQGDYAFVGAYSNDSLANNGGLVFIYEKHIDNWSLINIVQPNQNIADLRFGYDLDVEEDILVVGTNSTSAYVFQNKSGDWSDITQIAKLTLPDMEAFNDVAINKNTIAAGAFGGDGFEENSGVVYIFDKPVEGWVNTSEASKLFPSDSKRSAYFGWDLDFYGDTLAVSAPYADEVRGKVYIFQKSVESGWQGITETAILSPPATETLTYYGRSVAISEGFIVIGSDRADNFNGKVFVVEKTGTDWSGYSAPIELKASNSTSPFQFGYKVGATANTIVICNGLKGVANVYHKPTTGHWLSTTEDAILSKSTSDKNGFGISVAISTNNILVGALNENTDSASGAAFIFTKNGTNWTDGNEDQILSFTNKNASEDNFGNALKIDGNYAVVGATGDDTNASDAGIVYVYQFIGGLWKKIAKLEASDGTKNDNFGFSVGIKDDYIFVGAPRKNNNKGVVYYYKKPPNGWSNTTETGQLTLPDNPSGSQFGWSIGVESEYVAISSVITGNSSSPGYVYIFEKLNETWNEQYSAILQNSDSENSNGFGYSLDVNGDEILIGANRTRLPKSGTAYLFKRPETGWEDMTETLIFADPEDKFGNGFGLIVSLSDNELAITCPGYDNKYYNTGAVYIYNKINGFWSNNIYHTIFPPNAQQYESVGPVVIDYGRLIVGVPLKNDGRGIVYAYNKKEESWPNGPDQTIINTTNDHAQFGKTIDLDRTVFAIGSPNDDSEAGYNSGKASFYDRDAFVLNVSSTNDNGTYIYNDTLSFKIQFSDPVFVSGNPRLLLKLDNRTAAADYINGSGSNELEFRYIVKNNDHVNHLSYTNNGGLDFSEGSIDLNSVGNLNIALPTPGSNGSLSYNNDININGKVITITNVTSDNADITHFINEEIIIKVAFSDSVNVEEKGYLLLALENEIDSAFYVSGNGTHILNFSYKIKLGQTSLDLDYLNTDALKKHGSLKGIYGSFVDMTLPEPGTPKSLSSNKDISIDGRAVAISRVYGIDSIYHFSEQVTLNVLFNEPVDVNDNPRLILSLNNREAYADYQSGSGTNNLQFVYTVKENDLTAKLSYKNISAIDTLEGSIVSVNGSLPISLLLASPGDKGSLSAENTIQVDGEIIEIQEVRGKYSNGTYYYDQTVRINIVFSNKVEVIDTPTLNLQLDNRIANAYYTSGSGTNTLEFSYVVQENDQTSDLSYVDDSLTSSDIKGSNGKYIKLSLPSSGNVNSLSYNSDIKVIGRILKVINVSSPNPNDTFHTGDEITIAVEFSNEYFMLGFPSLKLNLNNRIATAEYEYNGGNTNMMIFKYLVESGDQVEDLSLHESSDLGENVEIFADADEYYLYHDLSLPSPGSPHSLSYNKDISIVTTNSIQNVFVNSVAQNYHDGDEVIIIAEFSFPVEVKGKPVLLLELDNRIANAEYVSGTGSNKINFRYIVQTGDRTNNLEYIGSDAIKLEGGNITSINGDSIDLTLPEVGSYGSISFNKNLTINKDEEIISSVNSIANNNLFKIYPNPFSKNIILETKQILNRVEIYDNLGNLVFNTSKLSDKSINLQHLNTGSYIIIIFSNEAIYRRHLIKY